MTNLLRSIFFIKTLFVVVFKGKRLKQMGKITIAFHAAQQSMANHPGNIVYDQTYHVTSLSV